MNEEPLQHLVRMLSSLPGLGSRSARRIALHLLSKRETSMLPLAHALEEAAENVKECQHCGNLDMTDPCGICRDEKRDRSKICIVAQVSDLWAIERTASYKGLYFILGGLLSALDGVGPEELKIHKLVSWVEELKPSEIILGLSATVDGQSTAHYVADQFAGQDIQITRMAHGMPIGGELDYLDDGTITTALKSRSAA